MLRRNFLSRAGLALAGSVIGTGINNVLANTETMLYLSISALVTGKH